VHAIEARLTSGRSNKLPSIFFEKLLVQNSSRAHLPWLIKCISGGFSL